MSYETDDDSSLVGDFESEFDDTIGGRIFRAREAAELSVGQLARQLGVKSQTLQAWENDRSLPRANRLMRMAGLLGVSPTWLLVGQGESPVESVAGTELRLAKQEMLLMRQQLQTMSMRMDRTIDTLSRLIGDEDDKPPSE